MLLVSGLVLLTVYGLMWVHRSIGTRVELQRFAEAYPDVVTHVEEPEPLVWLASTIDFGLWSSKRVRDYESALTAPMPPPLAILSIPRINLEVAVLEGTDEWTLNRAVGRIAGTAAVGAPGNLGIAGHRDGFFRGLKELVEGDKLDLLTPEGKQEYEVDGIRIVYPRDVEVLDSRPAPSLTLVTCYPFYYVGSAPQRYIVQATLLPGRDSTFNRYKSPGLP